MAFPSTLDDFTNPTSTDPLYSARVRHSTQHTQLNNAVEAIEATVGVTGSAVVTSHDYRIAQLESGGSGYNDEDAQDAVGGILTDTATIDFTYNDATPSITASVINDSITFAKIQNIATDSLIGRDTAGSGDPENILLNATLSMDGSGNLQRAALTGDVTASAGSNATIIANNAVSDAKLRDSGALSVIGRAANSSGDPADIAAGTDHQVLRRSGTTLAFGALNLAQAAAVTGALAIANGGTNSAAALNSNRAMVSSSGAIVESSAFSANQILGQPDAGGVPAPRNLVPSGSTLPSSPRTYDLYGLAPTGRAYLMAYDGSTWQPIEALGSTTLYVNGTSGTNSQAKGFGTGTDAYATIQYAIDQLPGLIGGNVTINVAAGTYAENIIIRGKNRLGNYTITINGTLNQRSSLTAGVGSVQGTGGTKGTVVRSSGTWTASAEKGKFVRFTGGVNSGQTRVIYDNTTTTLTICGVWGSGAPANTDPFVIEDGATGATIISPASGDSVLINNGGTKVIVQNMRINDSGGGAFSVKTDGAVAEFKQCQLFSVINQTGSSLIISRCYHEYAGVGGYTDRCVENQAYFETVGSFINVTANSIRGVVNELTGRVYFTEGSVFRGNGAASLDGLFTYSVATGFATDYVTFSEFSNWDTGIKCALGGIQQGTDPTYITYSSNTTNRSEDTATSGHYST